MHKGGDNKRNKDMGMNREMDVGREQFKRVSPFREKNTPIDCQLMGKGTWALPVLGSYSIYSIYKLQYSKYSYSAYVNRQMARLMDIDGWVDGWIDRQTDKVYCQLD